MYPDQPASQPTPGPTPQPTLPPTPEPTPPHYSILAAISSFFSHWFVSWIVVPAGLVLFLHFFVFSAYHVVGSSMTPNLQNSDYLIVSKVNKTIATLQGKPYVPERGHIVVFHYPKQPELDFVKRVVGLPGDRVVVKDCNVTVYPGQQAQGFNPDAKRKVAGDCTEGEVDTIVPQHDIFVLGDNRTPGGSSDSREWGFLPSHNIIGNAILRLYPLNSVQIF